MTKTVKAFLTQQRFNLSSYFRCILYGVILPVLETEKRMVKAVMGVLFEMNNEEEEIPVNTPFQSALLSPNQYFHFIDKVYGKFFDTLTFLTFVRSIGKCCKSRS